MKPIHVIYCTLYIIEDNHCIPACLSSLGW